MKSRLFILAVLIIFASKVISNEVPAKPANELLMVENQLKTVLSKLGDEVSFSYSSNDTLEFRYHTRKFMVHSGTMIGKFSEKAIEQTGPDYDGFILWGQLQDAGVANQAVTPQVIRNPYWNTYLDVTPLTGTNKQIYWGYSYGNRTDEKVLAQIKEALWKLDKSRKITNNDEKQVPVKKGEELTGIFKKNIKSESPYRLELTEGNSLNLRGKILENLKEGACIGVTGQIHTQLYKSPSPEAAMSTHWDIWMELVNYKEISQSFEIDDLD